MSSRARKYRLPSVAALPGLILFGFIFILILANALPAWAALGGDKVSILADQGQMQGERKQITVDAYAVQEIHADNGTVVREYQGADGNVFAVAWHGPFMPDMRQILGNYFTQYAQAREAQKGMRGGRHPIMINQPGLVVQIGGHPGWFIGKAYIPGKVPEGLKVEDIQ
jgi:hypothetical protein